MLIVTVVAITSITVSGGAMPDGVREVVADLRATGSQQWSDSLAWGISASDEQNEYDSQFLAGMGAGGDSLLVPAGSHLVCYR